MDLGERTVFHASDAVTHCSEPSAMRSFAATRVAGARLSDGDPVVESLVKPQRGAVLLYPIATKEAPDDVVSALVLFPPATARTGGGRLFSSRRGTVGSQARRSSIVSQAKMTRPPEQYVNVT
jgi:hypothetical protein